MYACKLLASKYRNRTFVDVLPRLKCRRCRLALSEIYLVAGHHRTLVPVTLNLIGLYRYGPLK